MTSSVGFATGYRRSPSCNGVFQTVDGGAHWRLLPSSCRSFQLFGLDFLDAKTGFVGGGLPYWIDGHGSSLLLATDDGGRSWRTVLQRRGEGFMPLVRVRFENARQGYVSGGGYKPGANGPSIGRLLVTGDGGRTWRDTPLGAWKLTAAGARAWILPGCEFGCGAAFRTLDGGRSWQPLARPENFDLRQVSTAGSWLLLAGDLGTFRSTDAGGSWHPFAPPRPPGFSSYATPVLHPGLVAYAGVRTIWVSHDGGRSWLRSRESIASNSGLFDFADSQHGLAAEQGVPGCSKGGILVPSRLFATDDGGRSWHRLPTPSFAADYELVAVPRLTAAIVDGASCGMPLLALSRDLGRSWTTWTLPDGECVPEVAPPTTIWLSCSGGARPFLLTSSDGGSTWTRLSAGPLSISAAAPAGGRAGWLVGQSPGRPSPSLWHSSDGGRTWIERWPALPVASD